MATCRKVCTGCSTEFEHPVGKHGRICKPCKNARLRLSRRAKRDTPMQHYEKTAKGFLMRYCRIIKAPLSRDAFYAWSLIDPDFIALFRDWTLAGWPQRLTPTLEQIDPHQGYSISNIRWITHSDRKASLTCQ